MDRSEDQSHLYRSHVMAALIVLKGTTRLSVSRARVKGSRGKVSKYERVIIYIPSRIAADSRFPFKPGQDLTITVDPKGKIVLTA